MTDKPIQAAMAALSLLALSACGSDADDDAAADGEVGTETLAALIEDGDNLSAVSEIMADSGLSAVFDGNAPYTVFAPTDAAFSELEVPLEGEDARAAKVAIVREHIVPGYLSREDIVAAIESAGGSVEMQTMGSNTLTLSGDSDNLVITSSDGSEASIVGETISGVNGAIIPVDTVLKSLDSPG